MAAPFGRLPTLAHYMTWLRECGGHCQCGFRLEDGESVSFVRLETAEGRCAVVTDIDQSEHLVPTMIDYLDRRLGVKSPWHVER